MDLKDLFLTPFYLALFYGLAFAVRKRFTNSLTKKYFIPALSVKFLGAISLGLIYQFYYGGGDTFNYYLHTKIIYQAFGDSFAAGLKILTTNGTYEPSIVRYTGQMFWWEPDSTEMFVVKIASLLGLLCFNTYTVIALFFAFISFCGMWAMYITFVRIYPLAYKNLAIAVLFLPSVFFWGSGLMKDALCIGALGWVFYGFYHVFIVKKSLLLASLLGSLGAYIVISAKIYILLSFTPPALFWIFNENNARIKSATARLLLKPFFLVAGAAIAYVAATNLTAGDKRFDVEKIGERSKITQEYLSEYVTSGSAYNIGELDGTLGSIVKVAPQAVIVALFRPFLFEARNPVMLLSALEATFFLYLTLSLIYKTGFFMSLKLIASEPILTFCFIFSIIMAIGVGTTSGNFGTLVRYKIPLMPFFLSALFIMQNKAQGARRRIKKAPLIAQGRTSPQAA
ncbi:hypothetical protein [Hymenobacter lapidiphilus]|uniref:Glycosyltransferase RgtA/B/C/D-like domain-containing protein n=1 Tax=Hymenobacter lapidiphilus TaxID=2608003 RepID=A0A7Y7U643_9BACT|nr:hypothetical protein [Hymenobacter lapidiphilus]NVO32113.1 hypothetical protein [Hymenobacter lapidiphilus]